MLFAEARRCGPLAGTLAGVRLSPLALVGLNDETRPGVEEVLEELSGQGIALKILSGDNPETVRATVDPSTALNHPSFTKSGGLHCEPARSSAGPGSWSSGCLFTPGERAWRLNGRSFFPR